MPKRKQKEDKSYEKIKEKNNNNCFITGTCSNSRSFGIFSAAIYDQNINQRYESYKPLMLRTSDFQGLEVTNYEFPSDQGQMIAAAMYKAGSDQKGIIIFAHGFGGGGYNSYLDYINYFAPYGWLYADPSFGTGAVREGNEKRRRFYFGNLDPMRMIANSEFQADFAFEKRGFRADPYDNQVGEVEMEDQGLKYREFITQKEVIRFEDCKDNK